MTWNLPIVLSSVLTVVLLFWFDVVLLACVTD
jgi:hypothetical protein